MKINLLKNNLSLVLVILLFGLILRILFISSSPPSLYGDELTITLDAYSLFKTGHDQLGNFLPLTFPMGAGRPAGYVYGSIPFIAIFGPTVLGARSLSIISGIGILLLLYLIGKKAFGEKVGMFAAAIGAVSPWDISLSRGGFEVHLALFLALLGIYLFLLAKQIPWLYLFSALSFGLTLHTYPTYKLSLIMFLPLLFWYQGISSKEKRFFFSGITVLILLGVLSLSQTFIAGSETRFSGINILSQEKLRDSIEQKINFERQITNLPPLLAKYFHNKPIEYTKVFIENYLQNFSLDFLVIHGDRNPRHNMATMGQVYFIDLILILIGLLVFWQKSRKFILFCLIWILLAPLPTAVVDLPHALRSSFMLPPLVLLAALGLSAIIDRKNKLLLLIIFLFFVIQFAFFIQKLYFLAPREYGNFWSYPAKLASELAIANKNKYQFIILSDRIDSIEFAYPVYAKTDPSLVITQNKEKNQLDNYSFKQFNNTYIGNLPESDIDRFISSISGSVLYIGSISEASLLQNYQTINNLDMTPVLIRKEKQ